MPDAEAALCSAWRLHGDHTAAIFQTGNFLDYFGNRCLGLNLRQATPEQNAIKDLRKTIQTHHSRRCRLAEQLHTALDAWR